MQKTRIPVGFQCNSTTAALELAAAGAGVVVAPKSLAMKFLNRGDLIEPLTVDCPSPWTYYATFKDRMTPSAELFKDWLMTCAAEAKI